MRGWRAARLRWRLGRPTPALGLVLTRLGAYLETAPGAALAVVEVECAEAAVVAVAALAVRLSAQGQRVVLADAARDRPLAALLGGRGATAGSIRTVSLHGHDVSLFVAPDDPSEMAEKGVGEDADAILILATIEPALGADHIAAWATDAVVMVRAGGPSSTRVDGVAQQLRDARMIIRSGVLIDTDPEDHSSGFSATHAGGSDSVDFLIESLKAVQGP